MDDSNDEAKPSGRARTTIEVPVRGPRRIRHSRRSVRKSFTEDELIVYRRAREDTDAVLREHYEAAITSLQEEKTRLQNDYRAVSARANEAIDAHAAVVSDLRQYQAEIRRLSGELREVRTGYDRVCKLLSSTQKQLGKFEAKPQRTGGNGGSLKFRAAPSIVAILRKAIANAYERGALDALHSVELSEDDGEHSRIVGDIVHDLIREVLPDFEEAKVESIENSNEYQSLFEG